MAPQAPAVASIPPANPTPKPFVPVGLLIFLGLCLAYTLSYVLYRIVKSRRRESAADLPDSPDRGVSQFMNGARLSLNLAVHNHKSTRAETESPHMLVDEEKPLTHPSHPTHPDIPTSSPADSPSTPFMILVPSFTIHPNAELGVAQLQDQGPAETQAPIRTPARAQPSFSKRVAAKVKFLSRDREEAIALDPKLAPVQGPVRPLSMVPSPTRKKRTTLFGLGLKHASSGNPEIHLEAH